MGGIGGFIFYVNVFAPSLKLWVDTFGFLIVMLGILTLNYVMYSYGYEEGYRLGKTKSNKTES